MTHKHGRPIYGKPLAKIFFSGPLDRLKHGGLGGLLDQVGSYVSKPMTLEEIAKIAKDNELNATGQEVVSGSIPVGDGHFYDWILKDGKYQLYHTEAGYP